MTDDFFHARLEQVIDFKHPLAVLGSRIQWAQLETTLAAAFARKDQVDKGIVESDLFGATLEFAGSGKSNAGCPRLSIRLMASLLYLRHTYNLRDQDVVDRWAENVVWQDFGGQTYFEPKLTCYATQGGYFCVGIGEGGVEVLLKANIDTAVTTQAVRSAGFERIIIGSTAQEKSIAQHCREAQEWAGGRSANLSGQSLRRTRVESTTGANHSILLEAKGTAPRQVIVNLGYPGVDKTNAGVEIIHLAYQGRPPGSAGEAVEV